MKRRMIIAHATGLILAGLWSGCGAPTARSTNDANIALSERMKDSLVFVQVTAYQYEQLQPWKTPDLRDRAAYACAVSPNRILTTAWNVTDAAFIKVVRHGQNETIEAKVVAIDYESNLCLLELDPAALAKPLTPIEFTNVYQKGAEVKTYWLSGDGNLSSARGFLDRAEVNKSVPSYASFLNFVVGNASKTFGRGRLYCLDDRPIGIACWANNDSGEVGLIPSETIHAFLDDAADGQYDGFGVEGYEVMAMLDPVFRSGLKMPAEMKHGAYVHRVYRMGTAHDILRSGDVILAIDGKQLDAYGRYEDDRFDKIQYHHLLTRHKVGEEVAFTLWRDGGQLDLTCKARGIDADKMLVPWYEFGKQPEYMVIGGYVIQKLTRNYMEMWGEGWEGKTPPHLYHYFRDLAFEPRDNRRQVVVLSYVLPADINLGYHMLGRMVIKKINSVEISDLQGALNAFVQNTDSPFHIIEFEQDNPMVVIPREQLPQADTLIGQRYGISKLINVKDR